MPATASSSAATNNKHSHIKSRPVPSSSKKTRPVRRRGRGKDDFESDDEFVREVGTDSESDDDDHSSVGSSTDDSDTEPASEDVFSNGHSRVLTPNTTQSSADVKSLKQPDSHPSPKSKSQGPPFLDGGNWSEMVAEEEAVDDPSELQVVDFADFTSSLEQRPDPSPPPRKATKPSKRPQVKRAVSAPTAERLVAPSASPSVHTEPEQEDQPACEPESPSGQPSRSNFGRRHGQSARQAYQQRLESDPSFVPTVGEFWGHDDRLLDKDWRSLSGWWRGRWQGRGRGRGGIERGFMRGRGRGGSVVGSELGHQEPIEVDSDPQEAQRPPAGVARVDQPWTHDGYEEMKKRDERRREAQQHQPAARPTRGFSPRGRGAFISGRGRGGLARGAAFTSSLTRPAPAPPASIPDRIWYVMKPERVWTKQHDAFLYFDSALKPRPGVGPSYRVKLPNTEAQVVRGPVRASPSSTKEVSPTSKPPPSEDGDRTFVVRLPKRSERPKADDSIAPLPEPATTVEQPPMDNSDDAFVVRPELAPPRILIVDTKPDVLTPAPGVPDVPPPVSAGPSSHSESQHSPPAPLPSADAVTPAPLQVVADPQPKQSAASSMDAAPPVSHDSEAPSSSEDNQAPDAQDAPSRRTVPPVPPPLQTVFPPPQPSPPYSSHYGYVSPLPPGIAVNQHGVAYEVATGRPVYLQTQVYTPRPLAHGMMTPPGMSYIPGHMPHHSGSPDFLAPPHTPPMTGFIDPATGGPLFAFPRQSARVEIRAPPSSSTSDPKAFKPQRRPSGLRTSSASYEPPQSASPPNDVSLFGSWSATAESHLMVGQNDSDVQDAANVGTQGQQPPVDPAQMLGYSAYHQPPYYYPEQYGYSQYYDMSHVPQYEMYHADPHAPSQGVVYY